MSYLDPPAGSETLNSEASKVFRGLVAIKCYIVLLTNVFSSGTLPHTKSLSSIIEMFSASNDVRVIDLLSLVARICVREKFFVEDNVPKTWIESAEKKTALDSVPLEDSCATISAKNAKLFYHLINEIPSDFMTLLKGLLKIVCSRRASPISYSGCQEVVYQIGESLTKSLEFESTLPEEIMSSLQKWYLTQTKNFICEERGSTPVLQSFFAHSFVKAHGLTMLLEIMSNIMEKDQFGKDIIAKEESSAIEIILDIFQCMISEQFLLDSPHTLNLTQRQSEKSGTEFFSPPNFLVSVGLSLFQKILSIFLSPVMPLLSVYASQRIIKIMLLIMKAQNENPINTRLPGATGLSQIANRIASNLFGSNFTSMTVTTPDPTKVTILVDMGFPLAAAQIALTRTGNSISRATDYILNHPEVLTQTYTPPIEVPAVTTPNPVVADVVIEVAPIASTSSVQDDAMDESVQTTSIDSAIPLTSTAMKLLLEQMRSSTAQDVLGRSIELVDQLDSEAIFGIKELLCMLGKKEMPSIIGKLVVIIEKYRVKLESIEDLVKTKAKLADHFLLLALIVSDPIYQKQVLESEQFLSLKIENLLKEVESDETWLPSLLLVLDAHTSVIDEPIENTLKTLPDQFETVVDFKRVETIPTSSLINMTGHMVRILRLDLSVDSIHGLLRILVRLTRNWQVASAFVENEGFLVLIDSSKFALFRSHQDLLLLIARHCIEEAHVIQRIVQYELVNLLTIPRVRTIDLLNLIKSTSHLVSRSPEDFLIAISSVCKLTSYSENPVARSCIIALKENIEQKLLVESVPIAPVPTPHTTPAKHLKTDKFGDIHLSPVSGKVIQVFTAQLLALKHKDVDEAVHLKRCFLLQALTELIIAYPTCKIDLIHASQRRNLKQTPRPSFGKNPLLSYLLNEIIPQSLQYGNTVKSTPKETWDIVDSTWASCIIVALCFVKDSKLEKDYSVELDAVRVVVVESIQKSFSREISGDSSVPFEVHYGKLVSLADLCHKILTSKTFVGPNPNKNNFFFESHSMAMARIMIEKGFVGTFTLALAELDIHHPASQQVVSALLRPLDTLSKAAIEMGKAEQASLSEPRIAKKGPTLFDSAFRDLERHGVEDTPHEISDMYRNSALGMHEPTLEAEDTGGDDDEEDFDQSDDNSDSQRFGEDSDQVNFLVTF